MIYIYIFHIMYIFPTDSCAVSAPTFWKKICFPRQGQFFRPDLKNIIVAGETTNMYLGTLNIHKIKWMFQLDDEPNNHY